MAERQLGPETLKMWRTLAENTTMVSALGEYTPEEVIWLIDEVERLRRELALRAEAPSGLPSDTGEAEIHNAAKTRLAIEYGRGYRDGLKRTAEAPREQPLPDPYSPSATPAEAYIMGDQGRPVPPPEIPYHGTDNRLTPPSEPTAARCDVPGCPTPDNPLCGHTRPAPPERATRTAEELIEARPLGNRFVVIGSEIVKKSNGEHLPIEEPLFLIRARDWLAMPMLKKYRELAVADGCNDYILELFDESLRAFEKFAKDYPARMKQPGVTRGK